MKEIKICSNCKGELRFVTEFLKTKIGTSKGIFGGAEVQNKECKLYQCTKCGMLDVEE